MLISNLLFHNTSIKAISFGIAFIFMFLHYKWFLKNGLLKLVFCLVFIWLFYQILIYNSRIVWLAIVIALLIVTHNNNLSIKKITLVLCFFSITTIILYYYKINSTIGRLHIYQINLQLIKENFLWGIHQPYNVAYNHAQANYFSHNNINSNRALLAANGFFPFNEWLAIFIRFGVFGFIAFTFFTLYLVQLCFHQLENKTKSKTAIAMVFFLLIVALVSYPFQFSIYVCVFIVSTILVIKNSLVMQQKKVTKIVLWAICCIVCLLSIAKDVSEYIESKKLTAVKEEFRMGYINNALQLGLKQFNKNKQNGELAYFIAQIYFQINKIDSSLYYINLTHKNLCTDDLHYTWAKYYYEGNDFENAKHHFLQAVYIVPNKFKNRIALIDAYLKCGKKDSAFYFANLTAILKEKVPSEKSFYYKKKATIIRDSLLQVLHKSEE